MAGVRFVLVANQNPRKARTMADRLQDISKDPNTAATASLCGWIESTAKDMSEALTDRAADASPEDHAAQCEYEQTCLFNLQDELTALEACVDQYKVRKVE